MKCNGLRAGFGYAKSIEGSSLSDSQYVIAHTLVMRMDTRDNMMQPNYDGSASCNLCLMLLNCTECRYNGCAEARKPPKNSSRLP